jgi:hypothetical protein
MGLRVTQVHRRSGQRGQWAVECGAPDDRPEAAEAQGTDTREVTGVRVGPAMACSLSDELEA